MTMITGKQNIANARVMILRSCLYMETRGMKRRGRSCYAIVKDEFGFKGNKGRVLAQLDSHIERLKNDASPDSVRS